MSRRIALQLQEVRSLQAALSRQMAMSLQRKAEPLPRLREQMRQAMHHNLRRREELVTSLTAQMASADPKLKLRPGFVQLVKGGRPTGLEGVKSGDDVLLEDAQRVAKARVLSVEPME